MMFLSGLSIGIGIVMALVDEQDGRLTIYPYMAIGIGLAVLVAAR